MRTHALVKPAFFQGIVLGAALAGVTFLAVGAARRVARIGRDARRQAAGPRIDGARPLDPVARDLQPQAEGNAIPQRLASEAGDEPRASQRW